MDIKEKIPLKNPIESASIVSKLLFLWIIPLFRKGLKKDLTIDDIYDAPRQDAAHSLGIRLGKEWEKERSKTEENKQGQPRFFRAIIKVFGKSYFLLGIGVLLDECIIRVAQPIFLRLLIQSFSDQSISKELQYAYALGVCLTTLLHSLVIHPISFSFLYIGMKCRIGTSSLIYRKVLRLSRAAQEGTTIGQLVNFLSSDVNRFDLNLMFLPYLLVSPIQTIIFVYILWGELGFSCLAGVGFVFLLMPLQYYIGMLSRNLRFKIAQKSDERGRIMSEIINGLSIIKMYGWELPFSSLINRARREEVKVLRKRAYLKSFYLSLFLSSKKFIPYLTFLAYVLFGHSLTADKVFFTVTIFDIIIANMVSTLPSAAAGCGELIVAIQRIEAFLLLEEKADNDNHLEIRNVEDEKEEKVSFIRMNNVSASWTGESDNLHLNKINVDLSGKKLVMIVGPVASGKSSFLQALLGELKISSGELKISGSITFSSQDSWIFPGTLRQNILFGNEYDADFYDDVVTACALGSDFHQFPQGDETYIGDKACLSGGQQSRINLARSLYSESDIYLIDDALSAVDNRVSSHIFQKCIKQYLDSKLVILVTHQIQYIPKADHIIVMNKGSILSQGSYQDLVEEGIDFLRLITSEVEPDLYRKASITKLEAIEKDLKKEEEKRDSEEKMAYGAVGFKSYLEYYKSGGSYFGMASVFTGFVISQLLFTASDYWLAYWTDEEEKWSRRTKDSFIPPEINYTSSEMPLQFLTTNEDIFEENIPSYLGKYFYISVYSGLVGLIVLATNINSIFFFRYCMKISINIHNNMFGSVVRAPLQWFQKNNSGRIMNRFTGDLIKMDESLPNASFDVITIFLIFFGVILVVGLSSNYIIAIPSTCLLIALLWLIRRFYIQTARDVKRIEAISRSPMLTHLTTTFQGLNTIRALNKQKILIQQFDKHQDIHSSAWFLFISSNRWFGIWLEMISVTFLFIVTFSFLISDTKSGLAGLAISSVMSLTFKFQWGMRQSAEMETLMTSVQRCFEYIKLESEPPLESELKNQPSQDWPQNGQIIYKNVSLSYDGKKVLRDISFEIKPGEKVGICGRTGGGKSSIISALFRLTETQGKIYIDGVNIQDIGLHVLRQSLSIVPQDPILFSGTVRYNLDPFQQFQDEELWKVLEEVDLKETVQALDMRVNDGGTNFSVGTRQLFCLGRALLRKNKIIVMDEVSANLDHGTDEFIQKTIQKKFSKATIIMIAHRLSTVMLCDKIFFMDDGCLIENDHPYLLLKNKDSALYRMAQHSGKSQLASLTKIAANAYNTKQSVLSKLEF